MIKEESAFGGGLQQAQGLFVGHEDAARVQLQDAAGAGTLSKAADMKKIFAVMGLAVKYGETVTIAADGADEEAAIAEPTRLCKEA